MHTRVSQDVALWSGRRGDKLVFEFQIAYQLPHCRRKPRTLRPALKQKPITVDAGNYAAWTFLNLENENTHPQLPQTKGTAQTRDPSSDDNDRFHVYPKPAPAYPK